jgi:hypothetical protein
MRPAPLAAAPIREEGLVLRSEGPDMTAPESRSRLVLLICSFCGRVRPDDGSWAFLEAHDRDAMAAVLGICPTCRITHYGDVRDPEQE